MNTTDRENLLLFNERIERIQEHSFMKARVNRSTGALVEWRRGQGWESVYVGPEGESIDAVILTARLLMQNNDRLAISRIAAVYQLLPANDDLRSGFESVRVELNIFLDSESGIAISDAGNLRYREILEMFVYGEFAHSDPKHQRVVADLRTSPFFPLVQVEFVRALQALLNAAKQIAEVNALLLARLQ